VAEVRSIILYGYCVINLFVVIQGCMQPGRVVGLDDAGSVTVLQVPKDESGFQSVSARVKSKLFVWYL